MKVNDPNLSSLASADSARAQQAVRAGAATRPQDLLGSGAPSGDDVHLSELVRSLRSLASESPERQAHLEEIARTYARGAYQVDVQATASKIIDDAISRQ